MTIRIIKACSIRLNGEYRDLKPGETLTLDDPKAARLISAGFADAFTPDLKSFKAAVTAFERDPVKGKCWEYIPSQQPDLWKKHIRALLSGDVVMAHVSFDELVSTWRTQTRRGGNGIEI